MAELHIVIDVDVDPTLVDPHEVALDLLHMWTIDSRLTVFDDTEAALRSAEWDE